MNTTSEAIPYQHEADAFDVRAALGRLRDAIFGHLLLIAVTCIACFALVGVYLKAFPPIYKASVTVYGDPKDDTARSGYYQVWNIFRGDDLKSEPALVTSRAVVKQVVEDLNLKFDDVYHPVLTQIGYLWTESLPGRAWKRIKKWVFPPDPSEYQPTPEEIDRARTIEAFKEAISLEPVGNTSVAKLIVKAPSYRAAEFANKLIDVYLKHRRQLGSAEAEGAYMSLKQELDRASDSLQEIEREKVAFDRKNGLTVEFERDKVLLGKWGDLRSSIADLEAQDAGIVAALASIEQDLKGEPREIVNARTVQESTLRAMMQKREFELSTQLKSLGERYRPDSPEVEETQRLLGDARAALAKQPEKTELSESRVLNPTYVALRQQQQNLRTQLDTNRAVLVQKRTEFAVLDRRMNALPAIWVKSQDLERRRGAAEARYKLLHDRFMMADVSRATALTAPSPLRVVDYAQPPMRKTWPDLKILLPAALLVGLIFGIGLAIVVEMFNERATRHRLAGRQDLPVYAVVAMRTVAGAKPDEAQRPPPGERPPSALTRLRKTG